MDLMPLMSRLAHNWQQKLVAILAAFTLWAFMNHSMTATRVIPNVALRVINLPTDKTVHDLLPSGYLARRINLTLTGTKGVIEVLEPSDLEVVIDAKGKGDEWIVHINRKNLASLNPDIDVYHVVNNVAHGEFILKLSRRVTRKIPIRILPVRGEPPPGYQFLDIWPQVLSHTVSGAEEKVSELELRGIDLIFDLGAISQEELDALNSADSKLRRDEVRFYLPDSWKKVFIPFYGKELQTINDPESNHLHIDFLRKELLAIDWDLPLRIYYPEKTSQTINPDTYSILPSPLTLHRNGLTFLNASLYVKDVSRLFVDITRGFVELTAVAVPRSERETLEWGVQFINPSKLEDAYVKELMHSDHELAELPLSTIRDLPAREQFFRNRFREYMQKFKLFNAKAETLYLEIKLQSGGIFVKEQPPIQN